MERPHAQYFRYSGKGHVTAKAAASAPTTGVGRALARTRAVLFGKPLASDQEIEERLTKKKALAIFSSDAISSSAYATEEIMRALVVAGVGALFLSLEVSIAIAILLAVVSTSYRQIGYAYPNGGGAYAVSKENFGRLPALVAGAALLVDYILTVAVSTSSAVEQITSAIPALLPWGVVMGAFFIIVMSIGNLRGLRESGNIFAIPTYLFAGIAIFMIGLGIFQIAVLGQGSSEAVIHANAQNAMETVGLLVLLRAFASGSVALTGVEAIANGVPAFKKPEPKNAAITLTWMAILLAVLFVGITFVADSFGIQPQSNVTVVADVASKVFGADSVGFYLFQAATALILILAANTAYNAFPRLGALLAEDGYMPKQFAFRGDRLAYTLGIVILSGVAIALLVWFGGDTHALIPLYSVGVFVSFTLSQGGMVRHWRRDRVKGWQWKLALNAVGTVMTAIVLVVVLVSKAPQSLFVAVLIPIIVSVMLFIHRQYEHSADELKVRPDLVFGPPRRHERVIIPVPGLTRAVVQAIQFGRSLSDDLQLVHVNDDMEGAEIVRAQFERQFPDLPFVIVESPYRALVRPFVTYLDVTARDQEAITLVLIPEYVARHWWERILYNQGANRLRTALLGRPNTVVANVPYRREDPAHHGLPPADPSA
ncbi:MAG: APC family permease [Chloroflexota bacterium]